MPKTMTKSIRLSVEEARETARLAKAMPFGSEAALIKCAFSRGLMDIKLDEAVSRYTKRNLSLGEVAELYGLSSADLSAELQRRQIPMIESTYKEAAKNLDTLAARHFGK